MGGIMELNSCNGLSSLSSISHNSMKNNIPSTTTSPSYVKFRGSKVLHTRLSTTKIKAVGKIRENDQSSESNSATTTTTPASQEPPQVNFAFVSSVLLPDGNMDVRYRTATGGQKLRNIMMDANVELYGPYARPLLNCSGGGTCGTCIVEVIQGKELLGPRTAVEREKLKKNPKNWRLACQTTVGKPESTGLVIIQQLPEWKAHEWNYGEPPPIEEEEEADEVKEES